MGLLLLVCWNRGLIYTVTAFTFGHSVTLAMVTLGLFDYPVCLLYTSQSQRDKRQARMPSSA